MKSFMLTTLLLLAFAAPANAQSVETKTCQVERFQVSRSNGPDLVLAVILKNCDRPGINGDIIWAPLALQPQIEDLIRTQRQAVFTATGFFAGSLLAIDGQPVGSITPILDRVVSRTSVTEEQTPVWTFFTLTLDRLGVQKVPFVSTAKQSGVQIQSYSRKITWQGADQSLVVEIFESGRFYDGYANGDVIHPGFVTLSISGLLPEGRLNARDPLAFSQRDSMSFYQFLGLSANQSLQIPMDNRGQLICATSTTCVLY